MAIYVGLLRALNVGGTGKLPMDELRQLCEDCGFVRVRTYITGGNVSSGLKPQRPRFKVQALLQSTLLGYAGSAISGVPFRWAPAGERQVDPPLWRRFLASKGLPPVAAVIQLRPEADPCPYWRSPPIWRPREHVW